jgi:hypothetical protein
MKQNEKKYDRKKKEQKSLKKFEKQKRIIKIKFKNEARLVLYVFASVSCNVLKVLCLYHFSMFVKKMLQNMTFMVPTPKETSAKFL